MSFSVLFQLSVVVIVSHKVITVMLEMNMKEMIKISFTGVLLTSSFEATYYS